MFVFLLVETVVGQEAKVHERMLEHSEVVEAYVVRGAYSVHAKVEAVSREDVVRFVHSKVVGKDILSTRLLFPIGTKGEKDDEVSGDSGRDKAVP